MLLEMHSLHELRGEMNVQRLLRELIQFSTRRNCREAFHYRQKMHEVTTRILASVEGKLPY